MHSALTMRPVSPTFQRRLLDSAAIDAADARALVESARALRRGAANAPKRLRGKNIALLCAHTDGECVRRFDAAAAALGARVARITPAPNWLHGSVPLSAETARLLENLYDAVDCEELPAGFAQRLQAQLAVPVFDGLARDDHPVFALLPLVAERDQAPGDNDRCVLLQATLVSSLS
jgi:ornithine carbamoyltransferase